MSAISASAVKELRETSGAGMMDCKKALTETNGDMEAAVDWLRKKGLASAAKKSSRLAAEGLVAVATEGNKGVIVEVNAETDFVARNDKFQGFVSKAAQTALQNNASDMDALKDMDMGGKSVADTLTELIATVGENMTLRRAALLNVGNGVVAAYVHNSVSDGLGKIGVLVALEGDNADELAALGKQVAMHIAAANPEALNIDGVDSSALDRERQVLSDQARASGKPEEIIAKMVEGRLRKYYEEVVLEEQTFVIDGESKVKDVVAKAGGKITGYIKYNLGEGLEKREENFADEVAKAAGA